MKTEDFEGIFLPVLVRHGQFYSTVVFYLALYGLVSVGLFQGFVPIPMYIGTIICAIPTESAIPHSMI